MFGSDNQNNQQQNHDTNDLSGPSVNDPLASGSLSSDDSTSTTTADAGNNGLMQDIAAPEAEQPASLPSVGGTSDDLLTIKKSALQDLSPLVDHIDQTPEEKFRTTMMMIQASDDQSLIKTAYEAAQNIKDDKARAQALLDVVNEINYFTQQHHSN